MIAVVRYTLTVLVHTQRWVAPALALMLTTVLVWTAPPISLGSVALTLIVLFPVSAWFAYATSTLESPAHEQVVASHAGSTGRVAAGKALTAFLVAAALPVATIVTATAVAGWSPGEAGIALVTVVATTAAGCALGTLSACLLPSSPGWAVLTIVFVSIADLLIPNAPPVHAYLAVLTTEAPDSTSIVIATTGTLVASAAFILVTERLRTRD